MSEFRIDQISNQTGTAGPDIAGITTFSSTSGMLMPSGATEYRGGRGRGVFGGAYQGPSNKNTIDFVTISTLGNAIDFGDRTSGNAVIFSSCSSSVRGVFAGGYSPNTNTIDYITISSTGNAFDFGDLLEAKYGSGALSNSTRGIFMGGNPNSGTYNVIQYITISTLGNASDFGDLTRGKNYNSGVSSPVRGINIGGFAQPVVLNIIDYFTIASTGDALDFGDLITGGIGVNSASGNSIRGLSAQNNSTVTRTNYIEYITIASTGNAQDFGDLTQNRAAPGSTSNSTRSLFAGGNTASSPDVVVNTIDYVTIMTTGNAVDFGDRTVTASYVAGCSDAHGGLGD